MALQKLLLEDVSDIKPTFPQLFESLGEIAHQSYRVGSLQNTESTGER